MNEFTIAFLLENYECDKKREGEFDRLKGN